MVIHKRSREVELGASENNISWRSERDSNLRTTDFKSGALTTRPRCLPAVHAVQCNFWRGHVISSILSGFLRGHVISSINLSLLNKQFFFFFLAVMLRVPLLFSWFSREQGVYCIRVEFWRQTKASELSASQKIAACNA